MSDTELDRYMEMKRLIYTQPDRMVSLEEHTNKILATTDFLFTDRVLARWTLEFLCFTIHTPQGRELYLKILNHTSSYCPDIVEIYWAIFDDQENLKERYRT